MNTYFLKISFIVAFITIAATLYINTFWQGFEIDILPYIKLNELVLYGLTPLINKSLPLIIGVIIGALLLDKLFPFGGYEELKEKENETGVKQITKFDKVMRWIITFIFFLLTPLLLILMYFKNELSFYYFLPVLIAPFSVFLTNKLLDYDLVKNKTIDSKIILICTFVVLTSYCTAKYNSINIKSNLEFNYIQESEKYYKLIGKAGEYFFFTTIYNDKIILKNRNLKSDLVYYKYDGILRTKNDTVVSKLIDKNMVGLHSPSPALGSRHTADACKVGCYHYKP